jgi:hypothetical protein
MLRRPIPAGEHERPRARVRSGDTSASKGVGLGARAVEHLLAVCVDATPVTGELSVSGAHPPRPSSSFSAARVWSSLVVRSWSSRQQYTVYMDSLYISCTQSYFIYVYNFKFKFLIIKE